MDIAIHWGVFRYLREEVEANGLILITAIVLDVVVLRSFPMGKSAERYAGYMGFDYRSDFRFCRRAYLSQILQRRKRINHERLLSQPRP